MTCCPPLDHAEAAFVHQDCAASVEYDNMPSGFATGAGAIRFAVDIAPPADAAGFWRDGRGTSNAIGPEGFDPGARFQFLCHVFLRGYVGRLFCVLHNVK